MENVLKLITDSKETASALEKKMDFPRGYITNWKNGKYKPGTDALVKIADYFGVSVDYLLGREKPDAPHFSPDAHKLLATYDELDQAEKDLVMVYVDTILMLKSKYANT